MTFLDKLDNLVTRNDSLLCIGLDPVKEKIPPHLLDQEEPFFQFNKTIINATFDLVCAFKLNSAFYEAEGSRGIEALKLTCDYLKQTYPEIPVIIDSKRADIGETSRAYAKFVFDYLGGDAVTLNPYLGREALEPFLSRGDRGSIILCRTSNPGASEFQDLSVDGAALYAIVARQVAGNWNKNQNCLLVVGATYPEELAEIRRLAPQMTFLVPGIGAQGGDLAATLKAGLNQKGAGLIITISRGIIYADQSPEFGQKVRLEAQKIKGEIHNLRSK